MKKTRILSLLIPCLIASLSACRNSSDSSSENSSQMSSEETSSVDPNQNDYVAEDSVDGVIDTLLLMKRNINFSLETNKKEILFTKNYYKRVKDKVGYINLPYHKDESKNVAYKLSFDKKGKPYVDSMGYYMDQYGNRYELTIDYFNFLAEISDSLSTSSFQSKNGAYYTDDSGVLSAFMNLYSTSDIGQVSFWFDNGNKTLNYELFDASNTSLVLGSFNHINNTKDEELESYRASFSWENSMPSLTEEQAGDVFAVNNSSTTEIYLASLLVGKKHAATVHFKCNDSTIYLNTIDDPDGTKQEYIGYLKKRDSDERMISYGLDGQNKEIQTETRYFYSQYKLPCQLDYKDFRRMSDGTYKYFALDPNVVYQSFAHVSINDQNCSFEDIVLNLTDNKVSSIQMKSMGDIENPTYTAITTFHKYDGITLPTSYKDTPSREITRAMSIFKGEDSFRITKVNDKENPTRKTTYIFDGTTYLVQEEYKGNSDWEKSINGYTTKEDGTIVPFRWIKNSNKLVQSDDVVENDKITNHFPALIDPFTVKKNTDGTLSFRELVTETKNTLWISDNVVTTNVVMETNSQGLLTSITYQVNYSLYPYEYLTFEYGDVSLPSDINVNEIGPMELTCYEDDSPDEWQDLVNYIGEEYASLIPYYYDKRFVGQWYAEPRYASGTGVPDLNAEGKIDYDDPVIGIGLYCSGSTTPTSVLDEGFLAKGFTKVESGLIDVGYRDDDYIANGYTDPIRYVDASKQTVYEIPGKLRVIYDNDIAFFHFSPNATPKYTLGSGLLIQRLDGVEINRDGVFH